MNDANLFQLGIGLETGAHEEDTARGTSATSIANRDVFDETQMITSRRKSVRTHLIIEVCNGHEDRIQQAFRDCVDECGATLLHTPINSAPKA